MQCDQLFTKASGHFIAQEYTEGIQLITQCIGKAPKSSTLYSNRALHHWKLGNIISAQQDLNAAIKYDHLNFYAYFNLFSLKINHGETKDAFDDLCCSLSALYLVRAKSTKSKQDVQQSLKYAMNNPQTHILKCLISFSKQQYEQALEQVNIVVGLEKHRQVCMKLKNAINMKLYEHQRFQQFLFDANEQADFRLHTTYKPTLSYQQQINLRVDEFNKLYQQLFGTLYAQPIPIIVDDKNSVKLVKQLSHTNKLSPIKLLSEAATKQNLPNQNSLLTQKDQANPKSEISIQNINVSLQNPDDSDNVSKQQISHEDYLQIQQQKQRSNISSSSSGSEPVNLYPIKEKRKIQITAISAFISQPQKIKHIYLVGYYSSKIGQTIKTPSRKIQNKSVDWYTSAPPTNLSQNIEKLSVTIYNKQYFSSKDKLLGYGEILIKTSGEISCPIYMNNRQVGYVLISIDRI